jgi:excinuclease ABC subunit A
MNSPIAAKTVSSAAEPDFIEITGAHEHNLDIDFLRVPKRAARGVHGGQRLGQVEPGVRHALRGGAAPLHREPVVVRAAVLRAARAARGGAPAGAVADHRDRAEERVSRTLARRWAPSPRSTTTCACSTRAWECSTVTSAARRCAGERRGDRGELLRVAEGHKLTAAGAAGRRTARGSSATCSRSCAGAASCGCEVDGEVHRLEEPPKLDKQIKHTIALVVDRIHVRRTTASDRRVGRAGLREGAGRAAGEWSRRGRGRGCASRVAHRAAATTFPELSPQSFSFNSPLGMCPTCNGLGTRWRWTRSWSSPIRS